MKSDLTDSMERDEAGFSMLEVMFSVGIFGIVAATMTTAFTSLQRRNFESELRGGAIAAAQIVLDELRTLDPATLPTTGTDPARTVDIAGRTFEVIISYCPDGTTYCTSSTLRQLRATVNYNDEQKYEVDTIYCQLR